MNVAVLAIYMVGNKAQCGWMFCVLKGSFRI